MLVFAHGIVGRADLPIPEAVFGAAAAGVLVVSFVALATLWSTPRLQHWPERRLFRLPVAADVVLGALGVLVLARHRVRGARRHREPARQPRADDGLRRVLGRRPVRLAAARRRLARWSARGARSAAAPAGSRARAGGDDELPAPLAYPARLGRWPAAAGVLGFGICELCWGAAREPAPLAVLMLGYVVVMLVGMSLYGVEAWTRNADPFGVYFGLFASLAPLDRRDGVLYLRPPVVGAGRLGGPGLAAVLLAGIGVTAFDGASEGPLFNDVLPDLQEFFGDLGFGPAPALELGFTVGLFARVALVALIWTRGARRDAAARRPPRRPGSSSRTRSSRSSPPTSSRTTSRCSPTTARTWCGSRPTRSGDGSDLFGGADATIDYGVVSATAIWYVQVAALVIGHVAALVLAHDRALVLYGSHRDATRSQLVMLVADGLLHLPRPVAALRGERMTPPFAHAGHWLAQVAYLLPLVLLVVLLVVGKRARAPRASGREPRPIVETA